MVVGSAAGLIATLPMTLAMVALHRRLPRRHQQPLPPSRIVAKATNVAQMDRLSNRQHQVVTTIAHFGYGAAMGSLFGALTAAGPRPRPLTGTLFGLGVWAGSYLGLMPATGLHEPATDEPAERNMMMIVSHVVWGAVAGELTRWGTRERSR
jgi:putative membrane protein